MGLGVQVADRPLVRELADGTLQVVSGHHRVRTLLLLGREDA